MPISCHLREPFLHLTKEQVLYVGWSLVHSENDYKTIEHSQFLPSHSTANALPMQFDMLFLDGLL